MTMLLRTSSYCTCKTFLLSWSKIKKAATSIRRRAFVTPYNASFIHSIGSTVTTIRKQEHDERYVNTQCAPPDFDRECVCVFPNFVTQQDADAVTKDIDLRISQKRYQRGHWDAVITGYREIELHHPDDWEGNQRMVEDNNLSKETQQVIKLIRQHLINTCFQGDSSSVSWLPCHAIDLKPSGNIMAHVDSVKFSGDIVAGLCLGDASAIMRLKPDNINMSHSYVDMYLPPKSLYILRGMARYQYSHELLPDLSTFNFITSKPCGEENCETIVVKRDRRISVIFRDAKTRN